MNRKKVVHRRAESWFGANGEKVYSESFTRVNGMDDLTPFIEKVSKPKIKKKELNKK